MLSIDARNLGDWVRRRRADRGLTQEDLAGRAGISRFQLIRIESGQSKTRRGTAELLALALGAPVGDALRLAGYDSDSSVAAEIGAQFADILQPLEPEDRRAVVAQLREWARGMAGLLMRKNGKSPADSSDSGVNAVLSAGIAWPRIARFSCCNAAALNL